MASSTSRRLLLLRSSHLFSSSSSSSSSPSSSFKSFLLPSLRSFSTASSASPSSSPSPSSPPPSAAPSASSPSASSDKPAEKSLFSWMPSNILGGLKEKVYGTLDQRRQSQYQEKFTDFVTAMLDIKVYTLQHFYQLLEANLKESGAIGWKSQFPGMSEQQGSAEMKKQFHLLEKMKSEYRNNPKSINRVAKLEIVAAANSSVAELNMLLRAYENSKNLHTWLQRRKKKNQLLPVSQVEMMAMLKDDPLPQMVSGHQQRRLPRKTPRN